MKIELKSLDLKNFKGIKKSHIDFKNNTEIYGANESGKTSHFDGFLFLFTGKDSQGKSDIGIKTTRPDGTVIHNLEHSVEGKILANGKLLVLTKIYTEKWNRKKGNAEKALTGHTTDHFIDGVPTTKKEYDLKISSLFDEDVFKLLTDARYFNEQMHWTKRREILSKVCGEVDQTQIEGYSAVKIFMGERTIEEQKKVISARKKEFKEYKEKIPPKIDENYSYITDDVKPAGRLQQGKLRGEQDDLRKKISSLKNDSGKLDRESKIAQIDTKILNKQNSFDSDKRQKLTPIHELIEAKETKINRANSSIAVLNSGIEQNKSQIQNYVYEKKRLTCEWHKLDSNSENIKTHCPACRQSIPESEIKEISERFNLEKSQALDDITEMGKENNRKISEYELQITEKEKEISEIKEKFPIWAHQIENLEAERSKIDLTFVDISELESERKSLLNAIERQTPVDTSGLEKQITDIDNEIQEETDLFSRISENEKFKNRITELEKEERKLSQEYADLEKQLFNIEFFIQSKSKLVESTVNKFFKIAKFKMFETQVNGGPNEICETMKDGVIYTGPLNSAGKIQVGIDIINTLQKHYGISLPIWIDNRESITNIPKTDCQTISLYVSPSDLKLRIVY